jgi:hypothetical protein
MDAATRDLVRRRADDRCEYCLLPQEHSGLTHHIEHIVARQHGGSDAIENLALACQRCNLHKGPNLTGIDPTTGETAALFHPRRDQWNDHFEFEGMRVKGVTAMGRTTVAVLAMNDTRRIELRSELFGRRELG